MTAYPTVTATLMVDERHNTRDGRWLLVLARGSFSRHVPIEAPRTDPLDAQRRAEAVLSADVEWSVLPSGAFRTLLDAACCSTCGEPIGCEPEWTERAYHNDESCLPCCGDARGGTQTHPCSTCAWEARHPDLAASL